MLKISDKIYLSISVSYKDELWNLIEWLEYHFMLGVGHIYICNNDSNPNKSSDILSSYVESGLVTNIIGRGKWNHARNKQAAAHDYVLRLSQGKTRWLAMLDMDEFIFPMQDTSIIPVLKTYEDVAAVAVNYRCFGSSGHANRQNLQIESFIRCSKPDYKWNNLTKSIGQVEKVKNCSHHHRFEHHIGVGPLVDEYKMTCGWVKKYTGDILRINHYHTRSREDFKDKMKRGNPFGEKRDWKWFNWADRNEVFDDSMQKFIPGLKERLESKAVLINKSRSLVKVV